MKTTDKIPTSKIGRASRILETGLKVGKNYASYYTDKFKGKSDAKDQLHERNAADIMDSLKSLKGGGLKVAQMLSMEKNLLPKAYVDQFSLAQFSVPALSAPLVRRTFIKSFGKNPEDIFDSFTPEAVNAASIGQVHQATIKGRKLAVKIQYPGVADSIQSDLAMLKPMASRLLGLNLADAELYFKEVESKLLEETDYELELARSMELTQRCSHLEGYVFPQYYPEYSAKRIITMDWLDGVHLPQYTQNDIPQEERDRIGQLLLNLLLFQFYELRKVHADPNPGNFLITPEGKVAMIDFGCVKEVPEEFFAYYTKLIRPEVLNDEKALREVFLKLDMLRESDTPEEDAYYYNLFHDLLHLILRPYQHDEWDFGNEDYFEEIAVFSEELSKASFKSKYKMNRGSEHFIYINRTFIGMYQLLHMIKAKVTMRPDFIVASMV